MRISTPGGIIEPRSVAERGGGAAGHCPTLGPKAHLGPEGRVGFAGPPYNTGPPYNAGPPHKKRRGG
jgi:hypothetical protein